MKRIVSFLLGIMLLCGFLPAHAEESLPYLNMFQNDEPYKRYVLLTPDSCPGVCISPSSESRLFELSLPDEPLFVVFSAPPADSFCRSFYPNSAAFQDLAGDRKIEYAFRSDYWTYEKFLEKVTDTQVILSDGSNGAAIYLSPEFGAAHALIALDGLDTGDHLEITITMGTVRDIELEDRIARLSEMILSEIDRIRAEASVVTMDRFWTDGAYRGIRFFTMDNPDIKVSMDLPEITFHTTGAREVSGKMFLTHVSGNVFGCYVVQSPGQAVRLEFTVSTWSVFTSNAEQAVAYTLSDGSEWGLCMERDVDGMPRGVYGSRVISQTEKKTVYLTVRISTSTVKTWWPDMETFVSDLETVLKYVSIGDGSDWDVTADPAAYRSSPEPEPEPAPEPEPEPTAQPVSQSAGGWQETGGRWYWYTADGAMATGWQEIGGIWYWFAADGAMATGWQEIDGNWYWFTADGAMVTGPQEIDGRQEIFSADGIWQGTQQTETIQAEPEGGKWIEEGGSWYYSIENVLATGWQEIGGSWYCFDTDGRMLTGWLQEGDIWYYLRDDGAMATGWNEIDGTWYYLHGSGKWEPQAPAFTSADPSYAFSSTVAGSMGFDPGSIAEDPAAAARFAAVILTDYTVAQTQQPDSGKQFQPDLLAGSSYVGTDGSGLILMVLSDTADRAFLLFYDTKTNNVFSFYEDGINAETAESDLAVLCADGYRMLPQETLNSLYNVPQE